MTLFSGAGADRTAVAIRKDKLVVAKLFTFAAQNSVLNYVNINALISNPGTDYFKTSSYSPEKFAGSNLYYFGARYYVPETGRFTSTDPAV